MSAERPKHFSMIRGFHLADFLTLGNAACGAAGVFLAMVYLQTGDAAHLLIAAALAPAALGFAAGMNGGWDWVVLIYFVCCGVSRLARYNVTAADLSDDSGKVGFFEGTPIPTSIVLVLVLAYAASQKATGAALPGGAWTLGSWELHPFVGLFALSGTLMISKTLRIPKL